MKTNLKEELKKYFNQRKDIAFAFLYGSQAKGNANKLSDVDIAVYFYPRKRHPIEYEEAIFYDGEDEIWGDLQTLLKKGVELLVLNGVSASVAASAIRGIPPRDSRNGLGSEVLSRWQSAGSFKEKQSRSMLPVSIAGFRSG